MDGRVSPSHAVAEHDLLLSLTFLTEVKFRPRCVAGQRVAFLCRLSHPLQAESDPENTIYQIREGNVV
ncbi:hypothetical protein NDU88_006918 [Pleurodeles waltl]|uniref:Uncharacterized protein n=1 Tax=Pleurodeles waltl TaxID=8319 RepID=A0AAV7RPE6_PLEWA|nr:hypothetical protein NDU88_006918 [Pleurodeles waltl]